MRTAFPFDQLIYYWNVRLPKDEGFRLYLQVEFGSGDASPWLYAGFWGDVKLTGKRTKPTFDRGWVHGMEGPGCVHANVGMGVRRIFS